MDKFDDKGNKTGDDASKGKNPIEVLPVHKIAEEVLLGDDNDNN